MKSPKVRRVLLSTYREGRCSRVVGFMIHVTDAAIAGDVRLKKRRNENKQHCVVG